MELAELHPLIVHAPLVLLPAAIVFRVLHLFAPKVGLRIAAVLLLLGGVVFGVIAKESGEAAEHRAEQMSGDIEAIRATGSIPEMFGEGSLLETHAELAETTVLVFMLLLLTELGLLFLSEPFFARWRGKLSLSSGLLRALSGVWLVIGVASLALVLMTGFYGGKLVYEHGVGVTVSTTP